MMRSEVIMTVMTTMMVTSIAGCISGHEGAPVPADKLSQTVKFWTDRGYKVPPVRACFGDLGPLLGFAEADTIVLSDEYEWYWASDGPCPEVPAYDAETALRHELGHILGLNHSRDPDDIMYYSLDECEVRPGRE